MSGNSMDAQSTLGCSHSVSMWASAAAMMIVSEPSSVCMGAGHLTRAAKSQSPQERVLCWRTSQAGAPQREEGQGKRQRKFDGAPWPSPLLCRRPGCAL